MESGFWFGVWWEGGRKGLFFGVIVDDGGGGGGGFFGDVGGLIGSWVRVCGGYCCLFFFEWS